MFRTVEVHVSHPFQKIYSLSKEPNIFFRALGRNSSISVEKIMERSPVKSRDVHLSNQIHPEFTRVSFSRLTIFPRFA